MVINIAEYMCVRFCQQQACHKTSIDCSLNPFLISNFLTARPLYVPPVPNFVFSLLLILSGFSCMLVITVQIFLYLPLISFDIIILADSFSNSFIISLKEFSLYWFDNNTYDAIQAETTYG
jgi:hypothetical protein